MHLLRYTLISWREELMGYSPVKLKAGGNVLLIFFLKVLLFHRTSWTTKTNVSRAGRRSENEICAQDEAVNRRKVGGKGKVCEVVLEIIRHKYQIITTSSININPVYKSAVYRQDSSSISLGLESDQIYNKSTQTKLSEQLSSHRRKFTVTKNARKINPAAVNSHI